MPASREIGMGARLKRTASLQTLHFFYQAEDGIRDSSVTGVQTCALPISTATRWRCVSDRPLAARRDDAVETETQRHRVAVVREIERLAGQRRGLIVKHRLGRSEERRVGQECRSRSSPYHYKKNTVCTPVT